MKKGQSSLEFLSTYSWALLILLAAVGTILYFDLFSPSRLVGRSCGFGAQLVCEDFIISNDTLSLKFRNQFDSNIEIQGVAGIHTKQINCTNPALPLTISAGLTEDIHCDHAENFVRGDYEVIDMQINISFEGKTNSHPIVGQVRGTVL